MSETSAGPSPGSSASTSPITSADASPNAAASTPRPAARALVSFSPNPRRGEPFEVRALISHPMETGHRVDSLGRRVPRDIVRRVEARLEGELVFAADLHPAVAANPYLVFALVAERDGTLVITWAGDRGFAFSASAALKLA